MGQSLLSGIDQRLWHVWPLNEMVEVLASRSVQTSLTQLERHSIAGLYPQIDSAMHSPWTDAPRHFMRILANVESMRHTFEDTQDSIKERQLVA